MEYLQESHLGDMLKVIDAVGGLLKTTKESPDDTLVNIVRGATNANGDYKRSLTSQASKLVMTFPVLASNTISPSTATMISKAIERKCVVMIQMLFAADLKVELENSGGLQNVINQYYTGIDFSRLNMDDMIKVVEYIAPETYSKYFGESVTYKMELRDAVIKAMHEHCYASDVSETSLNDFQITCNESVVPYAKKSMEEIIREADSDKYNVPDFDGKFNPDEFITNSKLNKSGRSTYQYMKDKDDKISYKDIAAYDSLELDRATAKFDADYKKWQAKATNAKTKAEREYAERQLRQTEKYQNDVLKLQRDKDTRDAKYAENRDKREQDRDARDAEMHRQQMKNAKATRRNMKATFDLAKRNARNDFFKKQLMDSDVKKANELVPSMLIVNYAIDGGVGKELVQTSGIIGVKTRLIPLDSFQILQKLDSKNKDKSGLVKFIRATSGEIRFLKDFVLAMDKAKIDAMSKSRKGSTSPIWKVLERRAAVNNLRKCLGQKNDASPITTLVITQEEVDYLRKNSGLDMADVGTANFMLGAYNLMGIVIVDESTESAKFLFDGEFDDFETLSYGALEKENGDSNMYKKVINLMSKRM